MKISILSYIATASQTFAIEGTMSCEMKGTKNGIAFDEALRRVRLV